jgi:hypothetical protein
MVVTKIVDLKTNLKSLKYESGNAPFVTKDINNPPQSSRALSEITRRADDVVRVTKAILPTNSRFLENQAKLEQLNFSRKVDGIKVAQGKTTAGAIIQQVKNTVVNVAKIAASTIAQTAGAGTGLHVVRGFENADKKLYSTQALAEGKITFPKYSPSTELQGIENYSLVNTNNDKNTYTQRSNTAVPGVTANAENKITPTANEVIENGTVNLQNYNPNTELSLKEDYSQVNADNTSNPYLGTTNNNFPNRTSAGVAAELGDKVLIPSQSPSQIFEDWLTNRFTKQSTLQSYTLPKENEIARNQFTLSQDINDPVVRGLPEIGAQMTLKVRDFRKDRPDSIFFDYNSPTINKEQRVGLGNKGYWKKPIDYTEPTQPSVIDRLNATDVSLNQLNGVGVGASSVRDLVKFRFEVIAPGQTPRFLYFRALLENLDDSYTGRWSDTNYVGRGDAVRTYEGFNRDVSLSFKIVATTRDEMKPLYKKMAYLASTTAPTYGEGGSFMKGTLVRLTVGSYLYEVAGTMNSVKYNWKENYPWEIAMQNPDLNIDDDQQELPQMMDCSINFTPIHDFVPQTGLYHYITSPRLSGGAKPFFLSGAQS